MQIFIKVATAIIAALMLTLITSCSDDEEPVQEDLLIGDWSLASQEIKNVKATFTVQGLPVTLSGDEIPEVRELLDTIAIFPESATLSFAEDLTYVISDPSSSETLDGTWVLDEDARTLTMTGLDEASQFLGTNSLVFNILTFTESELSLLASVPDISLDGLSSIPGAESLDGATVSGDYQLDLRK